ncbi:MAG: SRPBCC family protein, partial [Acidimicrobiales bacterium]
MDLAEEYEALRRDAGVVELPRDFLRVAGPDALSWLQGQLSQDVARLAVGASADSLLLQPQGKVVAFLRVLRLGEEEYVLETDAGFAAAAVERLNRFKLRVKAEIGPLAWKCLAVRGPAAHEAVGDLPAVVAEHGLDVDGLVFHHREDWEVAANWKIACENFLECYHCPVAHPGFSATVDVSPDNYELETA